MSDISSGNVVEDTKFVHPNSSAQMLYANGFIAGLTAFDMYVIGIVNSMPSFTINMSYTTAKSLAHLMNNLVQDFESKMGQEIPTSDQIAFNLKTTEK